MRNFLLNIWSWLTETKVRYDISDPDPFSEEEYRRWIQQTKQQSEKESEQRKNRAVEFVWCLVGNVIDEHPVGENKEIKRGTKHFSPGTKVYCFPPQWGDGYEKIYVMGRPRQRPGFIKVVLSSDLVTNWRIQRVFTPHIKKEMIRDNGWDETDSSKETILTLLNSILKNEVDKSRLKK